MRTQIRTEALALHFCNIIKKELIQKNYTKDWFFEFKIIKSELPDDFNEDEFLSFFKETFEIKRINLDDLGYCLRLVGKVQEEDYIISMGSVAEDFMNKAYSEANEQLRVLNAMQVPNLSKGNGK